MKTRTVIFLLSALATFLLTTEVAWPHPAAAAHQPQALTPSYLNQFPSVEKIKADVRGSDAIETAAKQAGIFWQLHQLIPLLAYSQRRTGGQFTPDEQRLIGEYRAAYYKALEPFEAKVAGTDKQKWFELHTKFEMDLWLRDEVFKEYFTPDLRRAVYVALKGEMPTTNSPEGSRLTPPAGSSTTTDANQRRTTSDTTSNARPSEAADNEEQAKKSSIENQTFDYIERGDKYSDEKDCQRAIEAYKQALSLKPDTETAAYVNNNLGFCLMELQRHAEAVAYLVESDRLKPNDPSINLNLGEAYFGSRKLAAAAATFKKAINLKPDLAEAHYGLGGVYVVVGMKNEALEVLRKLTKLDPQMAQMLREQINKMK